MPSKRTTDIDSHDNASPQDDWGALDEFCSQIDLEEVEFNQWCDVHRTLDLSVDLFITEQESIDGVEKEVRFAKSMYEESGEIKVIKQIRVVKVPPGSEDGFVLELKECGDEDRGAIGSLFVTIRYN